MKKFIPKHTQGGFVTINKHTMYMPPDIYKILGSPEKIDIYFDKENKVVKVVSDKKGLLPVRHTARVSTIVNISGLDMPKGRYFYDGEVFKYQ